MSLLYGRHEFVAEWVREKLGFGGSFVYKAIGVVKDFRLIAGVIYEDFRLDAYGNMQSVEMTIASIDKSWCTRHNLFAFFAYPFSQLNVKRVQATIREEDFHTRRFLERLGFTLEGIGREAHPLGGNAAVFSMLKTEFEGKYNGKRRTCAFST